MNAEPTRSCDAAKTLEGRDSSNKGQASRLRDLSLLPAAGHHLWGPVGVEWPHPKAHLSLLSYQGRQRVCQPGEPSPGETWQIPAQEAGRGKEQGRGIGEGRDSESQSWGEGAAGA